MSAFWISFLGGVMLSLSLSLTNPKRPFWLSLTISTLACVGVSLIAFGTMK